MERDSRPSEQRFVRRALIAIGLAALAVLAWQLRTVVVLLFGAVVMATVVRALADPLSKHLRLPERVAVLIAVLLIVGVIAGVAWLLGQQIAAQMDALTTTLPTALGRVDQWLASFGLDHPFKAWLDAAASQRWHSRLALRWVAVGGKHWPRQFPHCLLRRDLPRVRAALLPHWRDQARPGGAPRPDR